MQDMMKDIKDTRKDNMKEKVRDQRNGLRPISINEGDLQGQKGYLIQFAQINTVMDGACFIALVELEDGSVAQVKATEIVFDDINYPSCAQNGHSCGGAVNFLPSR